MNRKSGLVLFVVVWLVTVPVIYYFSPFLSEVTFQSSAPPGISYSTRENRYAGYNNLVSKTSEDIPIYNVIGNHELKSIENSKQVHNDYFGYFRYADKPKRAPNSQSPYYWYSWNLNGYHFIALNTTENYSNPFFHGHVPNILVGGAYTLSQKQIKWLENDLEKTKNPTIVFCHVPLDDYGIMSYDTLTNQKKVRNILAKSNKVAAVIEGHTHHLGAPDYDGYKWTENNIPYLYLPALGSPYGGPRFSTIKLNPSEKEIRINAPSLRGESRVFQDEEWELSYDISHSDFSPVQTHFNVSRGEDRFVVSGLDPGVVYRGRIFWENYVENFLGGEPNKILRTGHHRGESENFKFKIENSFFKKSIPDENNGFLEVENIQVTEGRVEINYKSISKLFKTTLFLDKKPAKKIKIAVFNDFHWGPKRLDLFGKEESSEIFSDFFENVVDSDIDFVVNNGDWIDGHEVRKK